MFLEIKNNNDTDFIATYSGVYDSKSVLFIAIESSNPYGPETMKYLEKHVELIGYYNQMGASVFVLFYFLNDNVWYKMSIEQLKLCWRNWVNENIDENCFQIQYLKNIRNTAFGPDFLEKIQSPFAVVKNKTDDPTAVFD